MRSVEEIKAEMQKCIDNTDKEEAHCDADDLLCELLINLGHKNIVDMFNEVGKWYA